MYNIGQDTKNDHIQTKDIRITTTILRKNKETPNRFSHKPTVKLQCTVCEKVNFCALFARDL